MERALGMFVVEGPKTTIPLHQEILRHPDFRRGEIYTKFLEHMQENRAKAVEIA
jgi:biotin carboxylase